MRRTFAVLLVLVPAAACGFPDVSFEAADAGKDRSAGSSSGGSGGGDDSSSSSSGGVDAEGDSRMSIDGSSSGDSFTSDGPELDAPQDTYVGMIDAPPDSPLCDRDHDGFNGPQCAGGNDCCDFDPLAFPGQTLWFMNEDVCHSFNYSCNPSGVTYQYKNNLACGGLPLTGCTGGSGFIGMVACGAMGPFATCGQTGTVTCGPVAGGNSQQLCH